MQGRTGLLTLLQEYSWDREGWFAPLEAALEGVTAREAAWQPPGGGNTIWQTLRHLNFWNEFMWHRITGTPGGPAMTANEETFGPAAGPEAEDAWQAEVARARDLARRLREAVANLSEDDLEKPLQDMGTVAESLAAWVMHDTYHTGQIVLIRKMQGSWPAAR